MPCRGRAGRPMLWPCLALPRRAILYGATVPHPNRWRAISSLFSCFDIFVVLGFLDFFFLKKHTPFVLENLSSKSCFIHILKSLFKILFLSYFENSFFNLIHSYLECLLQNPALLTFKSLFVPFCITFFSSLSFEN